MKRHLPWLIPALCVPGIYLGSMWVVTTIEARPWFKENVGLGFAAFGLIAVALIGPMVAAIVAIRRAARMWRAWRGANGHYTSTERKARAATGIALAASSQGWAAACRVRALLIARGIPAPITVWEVVPDPGEVMFFDLQADYSRYYGQDVTYSTGGGFFYGHPAFVLTGVAAMAIGNASRRSAAQAQAQTQWRDFQPARVIVTNQRLICWADGRWLTFSYSAMTAVYPEVDHWALVCEFGDVAVPLRITGVNAPLIAVMTILLTHGPDALVAHPSLQTLGAGYEHVGPR
jgi:hypothetical protein